jgi:hypothetical protein
VKYWEIIADNLSKAGWSWGCLSAVDCDGRTLWIADAHRGDGQRFVVLSKANKLHQDSSIQLFSHFTKYFAQIAFFGPKDFLPIRIVA